MISISYQKRRIILFDTFLCVLLPVICVALCECKVLSHMLLLIYFWYVRSLYCPRTSIQHSRTNRMLSCNIQHSPGLLHHIYVAYRVRIDLRRLLLYVIPLQINRNLNIVNYPRQVYPCVYSSPVKPNSINSSQRKPPSRLADTSDSWPSH